MPTSTPPTRSSTRCTTPAKGGDSDGKGAFGRPFSLRVHAGQPGQAFEITTNRPRTFTSWKGRFRPLTCGCNKVRECHGAGSHAEEAGGGPPGDLGLGRAAAPVRHPGAGAGEPAPLARGAGTPPRLGRAEAAASGGSGPRRARAHPGGQAGTGRALRPLAPSGRGLGEEPRRHPLPRQCHGGPGREAWQCAGGRDRTASLGPAPSRRPRNRRTRPARR